MKKTTTQTITTQTLISEKALVITFAFALGLLFIFGSGFSQSTGLHDAAHDTRHAIGFPCH